ncbi:MAG: AtpZ/AtpI family protein [Phycisphaerales bacterium]|nr:AtpZ/AtpI family protein [Phycisphaerales bacterium]
MPSDRDDDPQGRRDDSLRQLGVGWTLTIEFLAYLGLLGYVGHWLDGRYGWSGKGLAGGLMLALAAWIYRVLRLTRQMWK